MDGPMNKNAIKGRRGGTSWHNTAKPSGSALEVNGAAVPGSNAFFFTWGDPAAEAHSEVSRGRISAQRDRGLEDARFKLRHRKTAAMKGRTSWQSSDPVEGEHSVTASRSGSIPSRHGGKHGVTEDDPWMGCVLDPENLKQAWKQAECSLVTRLLCRNCRNRILVTFVISLMLICAGRGEDPGSDLPKSGIWDATTDQSEKPNGLMPGENDEMEKLLEEDLTDFPPDDALLMEEPSDENEPIEPETEKVGLGGGELEPLETEEELEEETTEEILLVPQVEAPELTPEVIDVFPPAIRRASINQALGTGESILANLGSFRDTSQSPLLPSLISADLPIRFGQFQISSAVSVGVTAGRTGRDNDNAWEPARLGGNFKSIYEKGLFSARVFYSFAVGGGDRFEFNQQLSIGGSFIFPELKRVEFGYGLAFTGLSGLSRDVGSETDRALATATLAASYKYSQKTSFDWNISLPLSDYSDGINSSGLTNTITINNQISRKTLAGIGYSLGFLGVDRGENQVFHRLFLNASSAPTVLISYNATLGVEYRVVGGSGTAGPLFGLGAGWKPRLGTVVSLAAESRVNSSASSVNTNYTSTSFVLGLSQTLGYKLSGSLSLAYEYAKYENVGAGGGNQGDRKDHLYYISTGLKRPISTKWSCSLLGRLGENRSNRDPFSFWEVSLYTSYSF